MRRIPTPTTVALLRNASSASVLAARTSSRVVAFMVEVPRSRKPKVGFAGSAHPLHDEDESCRGAANWDTYHLCDYTESQWGYARCGSWFCSTAHQHFGWGMVGDAHPALSTCTV